MPPLRRREGESTETVAGGAKGGIQSLERAAAILNTVAASGSRGATLADVASQVGLHSSTAFHLMKTLEQLGFLSRSAEGKEYFIGPCLFALAAGAPRYQTLIRFGQPILDALSRETGEASHLAVRNQSSILLIARAAATGMLQLAETTGVPRPAHATAIGKLLLSACREEDLEAILEAIPYHRYTPRTLTSKRALREDVIRARAKGYAEDMGELDENVRCLAVGVTDYTGQVVAAIGISGPIWRLDDGMIERHHRTLKEQALALSALLGSKP